MFIDEVLQCVNTRSAFSLYDTYVTRCTQLTEQNRYLSDKELPSRSNDSDCFEAQPHSFQMILTGQITAERTTRQHDDELATNNY